MMMLKMMSSLQPSPLASLLRGLMAAHYLLLSNALSRSNTSRESGPAQPTSLAADLLRNTIDRSMAEAVDVAVPKP